MRAVRLEYQKTNRFQLQVLDYLQAEDWLSTFVTAFPDIESLKQQIQNKAGKVNRQILSQVLHAQYEGLSQKSEAINSLNLLQQENTFTICTAHQPNIFLGPFYLVLKTIHAIQLATECKRLFPEYHFVPVFYIGSEDHDMDEIGTLHLGEETVRWQPEQKGACGEMKLDSLQVEIEKIKSFLSEYVEDEKWLMDLIHTSYQSEKNLTQATRHFLHELLGDKGLLIFDANNRESKSLIKNILRDELSHQSSEKLVAQTVSQLSQKVDIQASPREINLFYKKENQFRERIVKTGDRFEVLRQNLIFNLEEILKELEIHPENFSPNVILRPLLQEALLPNIAFIGGGGELSYWLQLKSLFDHHQIPFPLLFLRQSVMTVDAKTFSRMNKHDLSLDDVFLPLHDLLKRKADGHEVKKQWNETEKQITENLNSWLSISENISPNLKESTQAYSARIKKLVQGLEKKFDKHIIRGEEDLKSDLHKINQALFPHNSLQERYASFIDIWKKYGRFILDELFLHTDPYGKTFLFLIDDDTLETGST